MSLKPVVKVSIIIPVLNEASRIGGTLAALMPLRLRGGHEVIVVDGGSDDGTAELAKNGSDRVIHSEPGRASQMNAGAAEASGHILVFLHADTRLPQDALDQLTAFSRSHWDWGRFDVRLSGNRPLFRLIGFMINLRSRLTGICTGDQAQFVRRALFEKLGGFPKIPLMEDVALSKRLKRHSRPCCIRSPVTTDSRRWEKHGPWRTIWLMWRLRWDYWRGVTPDVLVRRYYG